MFRSDSLSAFRARPVIANENTMRGDKQGQARSLAALEAALASELTATRTMTIAAASVAGPQDLEPAVGAWIADWTEYHTDRAENAITKHALRVAIGQVNSQRVTDAVWHHHHTEWAASQTDTTRDTAASSMGLRVSVPGNVPRALPVEVLVNDEPRVVPATCARVLFEVATGQNPIRFRAETHRKLLEHLPEVLPHLVRDDGLKIVSKQVAYRPSEALRSATQIIPGTSSGTAV